MSNLQITSNAFKNQTNMPDRFAYTNQNLSPALSWTQGPAGTETYVIICQDPDAPRTQPWVHWLIFNIPKTQLTIDQACPKNALLSTGAGQGVNDYQKIGWDGPNPPSGTHRYVFTLYALDTKLNLNKPTKNILVQAMQGHILAQATLTGLYKNKS